MATISELGTTSALRAQGYNINSTLTDTEEAALALFAGRDDVCLVRGASVLGRPDMFVFTVMLKCDCLWFSCQENAQRFAAAVEAAGHEAVLEHDEDADEFDEPFRFGVTYTGPVVTVFSETPHSPLGRLASRFQRNR